MFKIQGSGILLCPMHYWVPQFIVSLTIQSSHVLLKCTCSTLTVEILRSYQIMLRSIYPFICYCSLIWSQVYCIVDTWCGAYMMSQLSCARVLTLGDIPLDYSTNHLRKSYLHWWGVSIKYSSLWTRLNIDTPLRCQSDTNYHLFCTYIYILIYFQVILKRSHGMLCMQLGVEETGVMGNLSEVFVFLVLVISTNLPQGKNYLRTNFIPTINI